MDARVDSRIPVDVKEKASKELAAHGLSISSFIRMTLSSVAMAYQSIGVFLMQKPCHQLTKQLMI